MLTPWIAALEYTKVFTGRMDGEISMDRWYMTQWKTLKASSKDTQLVPCRLFLHRCNLDLETLIDAGEQGFKKLAFELG